MAANIEINTPGLEAELIALAKKYNMASVCLVWTQNVTLALQGRIAVADTLGTTYEQRKLLSDVMLETYLQTLNKQELINQINEG